MPSPILRPTPAINTSQPIGFWKQFCLALSLMLGTGIFVGMGIAIKVAGIGVLGAVTLAALWAGLNQAVLTRFPTATQRTDADWQHFAATWTLFLARLTAVATAALGLAGYLLKGLRLTDPIWLIPVALVAVIALTGVLFRLTPKAAQTTVILVMVTLLGLVLAGLPATIHLDFENLPIQPNGTQGWMTAIANGLQAAALLSVAYASEQNFTAERILRLSKAFRFALILAWLLYLGVAAVGLSALGLFLESDVTWVAPLATLMQNLPLPGGVYWISAGAVVGMASVAMRLLPQLLADLLELSRTPTLLSTLLTSAPPESLSPRLAKLLIGIALGCIVLVGDVKTTWSFSAFTLLLSAALRHWIALRERAAESRRPYQLGLTSSLFLAFWVSWEVWLVSLGLVALALIWRGVQYWSEEP